MANNLTAALPDQISTSRLLLRPYRFSDAPEMHNYLQDNRGSQYLEGADTPLSLEDIETIIARHILVDTNTRQVWAITVADDVIGAITINFAKARRVAEIGYHINPALWGQGYATEAVRAVVEAGFAHCAELLRIQANIHPENLGSIRVAEKIGMQYEGTLRAYAFIAGKPADEHVYAVLR